MKKNSKEFINYTFFGILTTLVNLISFWLLKLIFGAQNYLWVNVLSWFLTVIFAYVTNKLWVFESKKWEFAVVKKEASSFFVARLFSLIIEEVGLYFLVDILAFGEWNIKFLKLKLSGLITAKLIIQIIVIVSNYLFSKCFIFKKQTLEKTN